MAVGTMEGMSVVEWANSQIPTVKSKYGFGTETEIRFFYQSENTTYIVENMDTGEKKVLRICEFGYHTKEEIEGEILFMDSILEYSDLSIPQPVPGLDGQYVQNLQPVNGKECYCVIFSFVEGKPPELDDMSDIQQEDYFEKLGEITAKMHTATVDSGITEKVIRPVWSLSALVGEKATLGNYRMCPEFTEDMTELFDQTETLLEKRLNRYGKNKYNYGLVHSDLRLANLMVSGERISIIDFDDSGLCWFLNDFGSAFSFIEDEPNVPELIRRWVIGYEKIRRLSPADKEELDTFILIRRLLLQGFLVTHTESEAIKDGVHVDYAKGTVRLMKEYIRKHAI